MTKSIAIAMPAYNEADGIAGFLREIDDNFADWNGEVTAVIANDRSTDGTLEVLERTRPDLKARLVTVTTNTNGGHGPAVLRAYQEALETNADIILQVDGDGQFEGRDIRRVADDIVHSRAAVAIAKRRTREDPWFRRALTRALHVFLRQRTGLRVADPNCPLRAYQAPVLRALLAQLPPRAAVPNVYLAVVADLARLPTSELIVDHRERRGDTAQGTMWGKRQRKLLVPKRLVLFSWNALEECRAFLAEVKTSGAAAEVAKAWAATAET